MTPTTLRHVFFDFDGVLCNSLAACIEEFERLRSNRFTALPPVSRDSRMDRVFSGLLRDALREWINERESEEFFTAHSAAMRARASRLNSFSGVGDLFRRLPPKSASIVSSAYNAAIAEVLSRDTGILPEAIAHLEGRDSRLPKTDKIRAVMDAEGLSEEEVIYVGDLESDLLYCEKVPVRCILVTYGYHTPGYLRSMAKRPFGFADSVLELGQLLDSMFLETACEEVR